MAKFEFLCSKEKVAAVKIGNSIYYIDTSNQFDITIFNSDFVKQNIIVPEYWLPEVSQGTASLLTLKASMSGYESGYKAAYSIKSHRHFAEFTRKLVAVLLNPESAKKFLNLFWVELQPFNVVKNIVGKIVANDQFREKSPISSRITLDRYTSRSEFEGDKEYSDRICRITQETDSHVFSPIDELHDVFNLKAPVIPALIQNIDKVIGFRKDA
jgi:hypothetical protein